LKTLFTDFENIVKKDESLALHSTMRVGGPCRFAAFPQNTDQLRQLILCANENHIRYILVGNASNLLFDDGGFDGLVIFTTAMRTVTWNENTVTADCGASLTGLAAAAIKKGLDGLTFAFGIPGTVGGAVYMNAGAYGSEISAVLTKSVYLQDGEIKERSAEAHAFSYRNSIYRQNNDIILSATFALTPADPDVIAATAQKNMTSRKTKQPLEYPNAGSVFKRPEGAFPGALIEQAGLKGLRIGGAEISEKHANFIVNRGGASSSDILRLIDIAREEVEKKFGITLETEIIYVPKS
jgi:UDP-N-acetylmuramate dehydrogenase